jgi:hypothetical protein
VGDDLGYCEHGKSKRMHSLSQQRALHCQQRQHQETIVMLTQLLARNSTIPTNAPTHHGPQSMRCMSLSVLHCEQGTRL